MKDLFHYDHLHIENKNVNTMKNYTQETEILLVHHNIFFTFKIKYIHFIDGSISPGKEPQD